LGRINLFFNLFLVLIITCSINVSAQENLCRGALGDPIRKIDFGRGPDQHGSRIAETTFDFQATGTPSDGSYTIAKSTGGMHPTSWHQIGNHTPNDPDGYMMIVNASNEPSVFYKATIGGLCANTTYEFAAWVINLMSRPAIRKPDLTFTISTTDGQLLAEPYNTEPIPEGPSTGWIHPGFLFTIPPNVNEIVISIRNNGFGGSGNDIAIDDITFSPCGPVITPSIDGTTTTNKSLCVGETKDLILSANVTPGVYTNPQYLWQEMDVSGQWQDMPTEITNQYTKQFDNAQIGTYKYRLLVADDGNINSPSCRANSPMFELNVIPFPAIPIGNGPLTVCVGQPIQLNVSDASSYKWTGPAGFNQTIKSPIIPAATFEMSGTYHVTVYNDAKCGSSTQVEVNVIPRPTATIDHISPICKGSSVTLNANGGSSYLWVPSIGLSDANARSPKASPAKTTDYTVYVSNGICTTSESITVVVIKDLEANAGSDLKIIKGNTVKLHGSSTGENIDRIFWTPSDYLDDPTKANPIAKPPVSTTYTLNVISSKGCESSTDNVFVKVYDKLIVPNSFSPNGDGINDLWNVIAIDTYINPTVKVVNRYGQLMFEGKGNQTAWNGKRGNEDVPIGVYYYMVYLEPGLNPLTGSLTVIR
jgi:gliding motility-associated-like protein